MMPAGCDKFNEIGEPEGAGQRANTSLALLWKEVVENTFERQPEEKHNPAPKVLSLMGKYPDDKIDAMRRQKDEELENYKKEIERAKRFANKQAQGAMDHQKDTRERQKS